MPYRPSLIEVLVFFVATGVLTASALLLPGCEMFKSTEPLEQRLTGQEAVLDAKIDVITEVRNEALDEGAVEAANRAAATIALLTEARNEARQVRLDLAQARIEGPPDELGLILGFLPPQVAAIAGTVFGIGTAGWQAYRRWQAILRARSAEADVDSLIIGVEKAKAMDGDFKAKLKTQRPILIDSYTPRALKRIGELAG